MSNRNTKTKAPSTVILGDSILKNVYGNTISKATKFTKHVVVKHFSGAKAHDIKHYMKPTHEKSPAQIIFHTGTNDLVILQWNSKRNLLNLLKLIKKIAISSLAPRKDKLNAKAKEVNTFMNAKCEESNYDLSTTSTPVPIVIPMQLYDLIYHFNTSPHRDTNATMIWSTISTPVSIEIPMQEVYTWTTTAIDNWRKNV